MEKTLKFLIENPQTSPLICAQQLPDFKRSLKTFVKNVPDSQFEWTKWHSAKIIQLFPQLNSIIVNCQSKMEGLLTNVSVVCLYFSSCVLYKAVWSRRRINNNCNFASMSGAFLDPSLWECTGVGGFSLFLFSLFFFFFQLIPFPAKPHWDWLDISPNLRSDDGLVFSPRNDFFMQSLHTVSARRCAGAHTSPLPLMKRQRSSTQGK